MAMHSKILLRGRIRSIRIVWQCSSYTDSRCWDRFRSVLGARSPHKSGHQRFSLDPGPGDRHRKGIRIQPRAVPRKGIHIRRPMAKRSHRTSGKSLHLLPWPLRIRETKTLTHSSNRCRYGLEFLGMDEGLGQPHRVVHRHWKEVHCCIHTRPRSFRNSSTFRDDPLVARRNSNPCKPSHGQLCRDTEWVNCPDTWRPHKRTVLGTRRCTRRVAVPLLDTRIDRQYPGTSGSMFRILHDRHAQL